MKPSRAWRLGLSSKIEVVPRGVAKDAAAVLAAMALPWSNGHTKGQVTRLVKGQMYGSGNIDPLQAGLIDAE